MEDYIGRQDNDTCSLSSDSDSGPPVAGCNTDLCVYGGGFDADIQYNDYYTCTKCDRPGETFYVCASCLAKGGHARHFRYMTPYKD